MARKVITLKLKPARLAKAVKNMSIKAPKPARAKRSRLLSPTDSPAISRSQSPSNGGGKLKRRPGHSMTPSRSRSGYASRSGTPSGNRNSGFQGNNMRIGSLTMNSQTTAKLDTSGKKCAHWARTNARTRKIRSFTGYTLGFRRWKRGRTVASKRKKV